MLYTLNLYSDHINYISIKLEKTETPETLANPEK